MTSRGWKAENTLIESLSAAVGGGHWEWDREQQSYEMCGAL